MPAQEAAGESAMMGRQDRDQRQLFYEFSLDEVIPTDHLLRRISPSGRFARAEGLAQDRFSKQLTSRGLVDANIF